MIPISPQSIPNPADGAWVYPKISRYGGIGSAAVGNHVTDGFDIFVRQGSDESLHGTVLGRMKVVGEPAGPFEVGDSVIGFVEVDMVDLGKAKRVFNKCTRHQSVDGCISHVRYGTQVGAGVAPRIDLQAQDSSGAKKFSVSLRSADAVKTADAPKTTHLVELRKLHEGHGAPFFDQCGIHEAGRPSGDDGSAIKSPSDVPPFGGLTFYIGKPPATQGVGGILCR